MKKYLFALFGLTIAIGAFAQIVPTFASPYPPALGGTGTSTIPGLGQIAGGNGSTFCFIPSSTNGYVLTASSTAPCGVVWALNPSGSVRLSASSTAYQFPYWIDANGTIASGSTIFSISGSRDITVGTSSDYGGPFAVYATTTYGTPVGVLAPVSSSSLMVDATGQVLSNNLGLYPNNNPAFFNPTSTVITLFQAGNGFIAGNSSSTLTTSTPAMPLYAKGTQAAFLSTTGDATLENINNTSSGVWDFTNKNLELWMYVASSTQLQSLNLFMTSNHSFSSVSGQTMEFRLYSTLEQADHGGDNMQSGQWTRVILPVFADGTYTTATSSFNPAAVNGFELQVKDIGGGVTTTVGINGIAMVPEPPSGIVTETFDDSYLSSYTLANTYMSIYGYPGVVFDIPQRVFNGATSTYMTIAQMQILQNQNGWDIACHTYDHTNLESYNSTQLNYEYLGCKNFLLSNGFTKAANVLAWPFGDYSPLAQTMASEYFSVSRSNLKTVPETIPPGNPYDLRALEFADTVPTSTIFAALDNCKTTHAWCIIEYHDISATTPSSSSETASSTFDATQDYIHQIGLPVETISDVINGNTSNNTYQLATSSISQFNNDASYVTGSSLSGLVSGAGTGTTGHCATWNTSTSIGDAGAACGTGGGSSSTTINGAPGPFTMTIATSSSPAPSITSSTSGGSSTIAFAIPTHSITVTTSTVAAPPVVDTTSTVTSITNSSTIQTFYSYTVASNTLSGVAKEFKIDVSGTWINNTGATVAPLVIYLSYGGVQVASTTPQSVSTSAVSGYWFAEFTLANASGTTNNQIAHIDFSGQRPGSAVQLTAKTAGVGTIDSTVSQVLSLGIQDGTTTATSTVTANSVINELLGATTTVVTGVTYN